MNEIEALQGLRNAHINDTYKGQRLSLVLTNAIEALQEKQDRDNPQPLMWEQLRERDGKPVWCSKFKRYGVIGKHRDKLVIGFSYGWEWLEDLISKPIYDYELKEQVKSNE